MGSRVFERLGHAGYIDRPGKHIKRFENAKKTLTLVAGQTENFPRSTQRRRADGAADQTMGKFKESVS